MARCTDMLAGRMAFVAVLTMASIIVASEGSSTCDTDTKGTCSFLACSGSRGLAKCTGGKCLCVGDYCARNGQCVASDDVCPQDTPGLCPAGICDPVFGATKCVNQKCVCAEGYCSWGGTCSKGCASNEQTTPTTCQNEGPHGGCPVAWGESGCFNNECKCKQGHCMVKTQEQVRYNRHEAYHTILKPKCMPKCEKVTGGTCTVAPCHASRGPTQCLTQGFETKNCICADGFCVINGVCQPAYASATEAVAALATEDASSTSTTASASVVAVVAAIGAAMGALAMVTLYRRSAGAAAMVQEPLL